MAASALKVPFAPAILRVPLQAQDLTPRLDTLLAKYSEKNGPGMSAMLIRGGRIAWHKESGYADLDTLTPIKRANSSISHPCEAIHRDGQAWLSVYIVIEDLLWNLLQSGMVSVKASTGGFDHLVLRKLPPNAPDVPAAEIVRCSLCRPVGNQPRDSQIARDHLKNLAQAGNRL